jgi:transposase
MSYVTYFTRPLTVWQRKYEALRVSFVDRLPANTMAERFGFSASHVRLLSHQFRHDEIDISKPAQEGKVLRRSVTSQTRGKIIALCRQQLLAGEIAELLNVEGMEVSVRTVERVLAEDGLPKLPGRIRRKDRPYSQGGHVLSRYISVRPGADVWNQPMGIALGTQEFKGKQ